MLPEDVCVRRPLLAEAEAVDALIEACAAAEYGTPDFSPDDLRLGWTRPGSDLTTDAWLVLAQNGEITGYAEVWSLEPLEPVHIESRGFVHPAYRGRDIGSWLLQRVAERAEQMAERAPDGHRVTLHQWSASVNTTAKALLLANGFAPVRRHRRMEIMMAAPPSAAVWPAGVAVRTFVPGQDDRAAHAALDEAFRDLWGYLPLRFEHWAHWTVASETFDPTLFFLACAGDEIAGLAQCEVFDGIGWVNDLAVRRPWRKRGIGLALLRHAFAEFYRRGLTAVGLGVDAQSLTGATRLYERAGMHVAREHEIFERELRAGIERSTVEIA
jgi:mycothiol synthase